MTIVESQKIKLFDKFRLKLSNAQYLNRREFSDLPVNLASDYQLAHTPPMADDVNGRAVCT
jgi:hypothetical protein